jgi:hypothetical protein
MFSTPMYVDRTPPEELLERARFHFGRANFDAAVERKDADASIWTAMQYELGHALRYVLRGVERYPDDDRFLRLMYDGVWKLTEALFYGTIIDRLPLRPFPDVCMIRSHWRRGEFRMIESNVVHSIRIPDQSHKALRVLGMPPDQSPGLSFFFEPIRCTEFIPHDAVLSPAYEKHMATHWAIGKTQEGDLLAISEEYDGIVVRLHHELGFATRQFANGSYAHLLISIEQYAEVLEDLASVTDILSTNFDDIMHGYCVRAQMSDDGCLAHGSFWGGLADDIVIDWRNRRSAQRMADGEARFDAMMRAAEEEYEDEMMLRRELGPLFDSDDFINGKIAVPENVRLLEKAPLKLG